MRLFAKHGPGRRTVAALLALVMVVGLVPMTAPQSQAASVLQPYLDKLVEWGVMKGDANGNLDPNRAITRAEYVAMTNRAFGYDEVGPIPFSDVSDRAWYAEDIAIGYNAGYFQGTSGNTASPSDTLTREQAAVMLGRNLLMQAQTGENTDFSDSRSMSEWSRGIVGSLVDSGIVKGYTDGTFKPKNNITRGEVASLLANAIGTRYSEAGESSPGYIYGNLTITASGTTLRNTTIAGDLYITFSIAEDSRFKRVGDDLYITAPVNLYTAILGGEQIVETMDGKVKLKVAAGTQNNSKVRLKGKGFPVYKKDGQFGDLIVTYSIEIPTNLTDKQKELFREIQSLNQ